MVVLCRTHACQAPAPAQQGAQFSATQMRNIAQWAPTPRQAVTSEESASLPQAPTHWLPQCGVPHGKITWSATPLALSTVGQTNSLAAVAPWMAAILAGKLLFDSQSNFFFNQCFEGTAWTK